MATNRGGRLGKVSSHALSTRITTSRHRSLEATHVLLREHSSQQLVTIEVGFLSDAARLKPLVPGRHVSFRDGNGRGQKQGEIVTVGTFEDVHAERINQLNVDLTDSPLTQQEKEQDNCCPQTQNIKPESVSTASNVSQSIENGSKSSTALQQLCLSQDFAFPSTDPTLSAPTINKPTTPDPPSSIYSTISTLGTSKLDNFANTSSSITIQRSPIKPGLQSTISVVSKPSFNPSTSRTVVPSTTIKRKMATGDALKEIKRLQSLVKSKDDEIHTLKGQVKKLKQEVETNQECCMSIPTNQNVIHWVDYLYESIHKSEIHDQLDLDETARDLGMERESLDLCLELSGDDRISAARQLFKSCIDYDEAVQKEHCWQDVDQNIIIKICRFVRELFGVSLKQNDEYVRDSLANMMRKDSWKCRNSEKIKGKNKESSSINSKSSSRHSGEPCIDDHDTGHIDEHF